MRLKVKQHLCVLSKRLSQVFLLLASVVAGKYTEPPGLKSRHVLRPARLGRGEALDSYLARDESAVMVELQPRVLQSFTLSSPQQVTFLCYPE